MESEQQQQPFYGNYGGLDTISSNSGYNNALQFRLDNQELLSDIKDFLSGTTTVEEYDKETDTVKKKVYTLGKSFANVQGIQGIMTFCRLELNASGVQGNYNDERYNLDRKFSREELCFLINCKRYDWEIDEKDQELITDRIISLVKKFSSRTLYNKERESYTTSLQSKETHSIQPMGEQKKWGF